jgi:hypothetical protein
MYLGVEFDLFIFGKAVPPRLEFMGEFDLPCLSMNITSTEYNVDGIVCFAVANVTNVTGCRNL